MLTPTRTRREREREARRESILDAAESLALEVGYAGLTMEAVAAEAEIAKGTVYLYFASKDALFAAIACRRMEELVPALEDSIAEAPHGRERVLELARHFADHFIAQPERFRLMSSWLGATEPLETSSEDFERYRAVLATVLGGVIEAVAAGKRDGSITLEGEPPAIALAVWHSLAGILMARLAAPTLPQRVSFTFDFDEVLEVFLRGTDRMLAAKPAPEEAR